MKKRTILDIKNLNNSISVIQPHTMCSVQQPHTHPAIVALWARGRWGSDKPNCMQQTVLFLRFSPWMRECPGTPSRQFISPARLPSLSPDTTELLTTEPSVIITTVWERCWECQTVYLPPTSFPPPWDEPCVAEKKLMVVLYRSQRGSHQSSCRF